MSYKQIVHLLNPVLGLLIQVVVEHLIVLLKQPNQHVLQPMDATGTQLHQNVPL
jgi:hypothetical protein